MAQNNVIHRIRFTPRNYNLPGETFGKYIKTISNKYITTLSGKKIKTNG